MSRILDADSARGERAWWVSFRVTIRESRRIGRYYGVREDLTGCRASKRQQRACSSQVDYFCFLSHNGWGMTVDAIKDAITGLPDEDKIALATWLSLQTMDEWDRQMARDFAPGGRGFHVIEKVKADIRAGKFRPMIPPSRSE